MDTRAWVRVPVGRDQPHGELCEWSNWLGRVAPWVDFGIHRCSEGPSEARNQIADAFLSSDAKLLWMVDSDTIPPRRLDLLEHDLPVVAGWYPQYNPRVYPAPFPCVYKVTASGHVPLRRKEIKSKLIEVDAVATGCMVVHRDVLKALPEPFLYGMVHGRRIGEDLAFCSRAREAGFRIWVDGSYECVHHRICNLNKVQETMAVLRGA